MKKYCEKCIYHSLEGINKDFKRDEFIFLDGDKLDYVYLILSGFVKVSKTTQNGDERIFDIIGKNDFIGLVAALKEDENYIATAQALGDVVVKKIPLKQIKESFHSNAVFKDLCFKCTVTRTNLFQSHLFNNSSGHLEDKIMVTLEYLTKKFGSYSNRGYILKLPFSKTVLASIIGVRRETLSRKLSEMKKRNIIEIENNTYIFDRMWLISHTIFIWYETI